MPQVQRRSAGALVFPVVLLVAVGAGVVLAGRPGSPGPWVFLLVLAGWVVTLCLHEFAHAATALAGGDTSVRGRGYLTLNPLRYTDPTFSLILPAVLLAAGGIPLPGGAVLIESHRLRARWWSSAVSAAGPLTNLVLGVVFSLGARALSDASVGAAPADQFLTASPLVAGLSFLAVLQFVAAILNLLPVPGLDGFGIIAPYLSGVANQWIAKIRPFAPLVLFALLWTSPRVSDALFNPAFSALELFGGSGTAARYGAGLFQFWR